MAGMGGRPRLRSGRMGLGDYTAARLIPYAVPWVLSALAMPVALLARWRWGHDPRMTMVMGAATAVLIMVTYLTWGRRHAHTRIMAAAYAGLVLGWVVFAASGNPLSRGMVDAWLIVMVVSSVSWDIRYAAWSPSHEEDTSGDKEEDTLFRKIKSLNGARTRKIKDSVPGRLEAKIDLKPGESSVSAVQRDKEQIASLVGMGAEDITVTKEDNREDHVLLSFQFANGLRRSVYWNGPSFPGGSVADAPLRPGIRADGKDLALWVCGDANVDPVRQLVHCLASGVTGSGKTETVKTVILDGRWRRDFVPVVGDPAKFGQTFGEIAESLALIADGKEMCERLIRNLPDAIAYRAQVFGELTRSDGTRGYSQWEPELWTLHGIPLVFIDLEEAADMVDSDLDEPVRKARSVGIFLWVSLQTAIFSNLDRKSRGQFGQSACHGMNEMTDAKFGLNTKTIDAGADPTKWGADSAGSLYAEFTGTPKNEWPVDAKAFAWGRSESESRAARRAEWQASRDAGVWASLDDGTAAYLGAGLLTPEQWLNPETGQGGDSTEQNDRQDEQTNTEVSAPAQAGQTAQIKDGVDVSQSIAPPKHDVVFDLGIKKSQDDEVSIKRAREIVEARVDALEAKGKDTVGYKDLADLAAEVGRDRAFLYRELHRLCDIGRLEEGVKPPYRINPRIRNGHRRTEVSA